jgi:hypothetical protein
MGAGVKGLIEYPFELLTQSRVAFPDDHRPPPRCPESEQLFAIPLHVLAELLVPERAVTLRSVGESAARVPVPETTVNENRELEPREYYVGPAGEVLPVQSKAVSESMER